MEIPDLAVVTKADMGAPAQRALADLKGALGLASGGHDIACLDDLGIDGHGAGRIDSRRWTSASPSMTGAPLAARRQAQAEGWLRSSLLQRFGEEGVAAAGRALTLPPGAAPFGRHQAIARKLRVFFQE